ncbi:UNVERIFIED_ORG: D-alanyl-D-alanine carboxypeptidase (penicillin-binding protein 5/6) [Xanthobacter viscosus]|jgi:D-alanyl-D-alanine carboxypeptidase (penicillin-binding protein 5/6)|uniref:serine-type D-Ala-D-Ala carboxypeptidase n=1 Tax=Xanthobacter autotrophicus TaxID=280 RepID=A0A6C1KIL0_XANAU|nr:D-alanyl-D-alanine carboxypeptidase family protein [Xanthobacter autotrophicus]TLX43651.1 D-alanyl-D-alanine carboxypeptidase [Xanthobacter autotrophicus]
MLPKLRFAFLLVAIAALAGAGRAGAADGFQTQAPSAILVDYDTGTILFEKDADRRIAPGTLAKVMTADVVFSQLKAGKIALDTPFTVSVNAWRRGGGPSGGAAMFAEVNKPAPVGELLAGMLVVSGNDAAMALAEGIGGTESEFSQMMTEQAKAIGMANSDFRNATGFADPGQFSTARDLSLLARHIIRTYPDYYPVFARPGIEWSRIKQRNRNVLLDAGIGADGLQIGWVKDVGYHVLGSAVQNGQRLIVVVLAAKSEKERLDETRKLVEWGFQSFRQRVIFAADQEVGRAQVFGGAASSVGLVGGRPVSVLTPRAGNERITARAIYTGPLLAPVTKGTQVGRLEVTRGQTKVLEIPLYTQEDVPVGSLVDRALDGGLTLMGDSVRDLAKRTMAKLHK